MIEDFKPLSEAYEDIEFPGRRASKKMIQEMLARWGEAIKKQSFDEKYKEKLRIEHEQEKARKVMFDMMSMPRMIKPRWYSGTE